jgi:hypothetical protein
MMAKRFKKGDVIGVGRGAAFSLIKIDRASRDGNSVGTYSTHPGSALVMSRMLEDYYPIGGKQQERARKLFDAALTPIDYPNKLALQTAILSILTDAEEFDVDMFFIWSDLGGYDPTVKTFMNSLDTENKRAEWRRIPKPTRAAICRRIMERWWQQ